MLDPALVPTLLVPPSERGPIPLRPPHAQRWRTLHILFRLTLWLLAWLGIKTASFLLWLLGPLLALFGARPSPDWADEAIAVRTRRLLERLGFLWIKVGQLLSLRFDLFSTALCEELAKLQYRSVGFPPEIAVATIEAELGGPLTDFFRDFEPVPIAAASIAQVHRARLLADGAPVVIKVMRPGAARIFSSDLRFLRRLVWCLDRIPRLRVFRFDEFIWEMEQIAVEEVDYRFELSNIRRFRRSVRRLDVYVPKPFPRYSTRRVLVMEEIQGTLMSDYIRVRAQDPDRLAAWLLENDVDPEKVAERLLFSFLRQLFEKNLFHGDLHPGNIFLLRQNHLALIDLGSLNSAEADMVRRYAFTLSSFAAREFQKGADLVLSFSPELPLNDLTTAKEDIVRVLRAWDMRTHVRAIPYHEKSLSRLFADITRVMAGYGIATTWGLLRIDRSFTTLDAALSSLNPTANYQRLFRRFFRAHRRRAVRRLLYGKAIRDVIDGAYNAYHEYKLFIAPRIRMLARIFEGGIDKGALVLSYLSRLLALAGTLAGLFLLGAFLHQQYGFFSGVERKDEFAADGTPVALSVTRTLREAPLIGKWTAIGLLLLAVVVVGTLLRLGSRLRRKEVVLPEAGKVS